MLEENKKRPFIKYQWWMTNQKTFGVFEQTTINNGKLMGDVHVIQLIDDGSEQYITYGVSDFRSDAFSYHNQLAPTYYTHNWSRIEKEEWFETLERSKEEVNRKFIK